MVEKDYIELGTVTAIDVFNVKLAEVGQKFSKLNKPFDEQCARLEFRDKLEAAEKESERRHGFVKVEEIKIEIGDLDKYADDDRFVLLEDQEAYIDKVIEGSRTQVVMGHTLSYRCKARGHGISVFVSNDDYVKMKSEKKENK